MEKEETLTNISKIKIKNIKKEVGISNPEIFEEIRYNSLINIALKIFLKENPKAMIIGEDIEDGNDYMAHKCGFTYSTLLNFFIDAGFKKWIGGRRPEDFALYLIACKGDKSDEELRSLSLEFLPGN